MDTLETQLQQTCQGKPQNRTSGRYNFRDIPNAQPSLRWPNEGVAPIDGSQRVKYDDLSIPQWVAGFVTNLLQVKNPVVQRHMLIQLRNAMRDAIGLPWATVRGAFASSMHEVEEGRLTWSDHLQWSMNRLGTSQTLLSSTRAVPPTRVSQTSSRGESPRLCKFYNEGYCSHLGDHGHYIHKCSHCSKLRRPPGPTTHAEAHCPAKAGLVNRNQPQNTATQQHPQSVYSHQPSHFISHQAK